MSTPSGQAQGALVLALLIAAFSGPSQAAVTFDMTGYRADCGVAVRSLEIPDGSNIRADWPLGDGTTGRLVLEMRPGKPLFRAVKILSDDKDERTLLEDVDPVTFVTVGTRSAPPGRPPGMSVFNVFFDSPAQRPHAPHRATLDLRRVRVVSQGQRATIILDELAAGPFRGSLQVTAYRGCPLLHVEAVVSTQEERRAYLYDAGLASDSPSWKTLAWTDTEGRFRREHVDPKAADRSLAVRHRMLVAESEAGSVACFPPPHQYFFPRDYTDNLRQAWSGRGHRTLDGRHGFGVRQAEKGGGNFSPWFNAPPGTEQHLGVFYLLSRGKAEEATREVLRYTHGDRFPALPGRFTFTSHWHMAFTVAAMQRRERGESLAEPDFVRVFKDLGVNIVHTAEFHGDGHQKDPGPLRLPELSAMFEECRRLSDDRLLLLPGEEVDTFLGVDSKGARSGHWMCLFPRPVYWTMRRERGQPFAEDVAPYGTVYRVGSREDMVELLAREHGLAWTSHPRIKASSWTPDAFRDESFYKSAAWLGAAWKAMPADLSLPRLGTRALDLCDDMANWGPRKSLIGEVDVFKIDHTHELYGHMNVNYLRLDRLPGFGESWQPVLDALRAGRFFVTTGEVLFHECTIGGKEGGEVLRLSENEPELRLTLEWTFPPRFVEIISGDGSRVYRERIDLSEDGAFGRRTLSHRAGLRGRRWARVEAWDVAGNGAFSQPVWLETPDTGTRP